MLSFLTTNPLLFVVYAIALLVALTIHEFSHAWMSNYLGDPTARLHGRLSLNPISHLDLVGTMFMFFFGFGWGKPVPVDSFNLKNPRQDSALISLAGPGSNIVLAILLSIILRLFILFKLPVLFTISSLFLGPLIIINISLGIFNLLPIAPLDGFNIVAGILSEEKAHEWRQLERLGMIFLLALIFPIAGSSLLDSIIRPAVTFIINLLLPLSAGTGII